MSKKSIPEHYRFTIRHFQRGGGYGEIGSTVKADTIENAINILAEKYPYEIAHCVRAVVEDENGDRFSLSNYYIRQFAK